MHFSLFASTIMYLTSTSIFFIGTLIFSLSIDDIKKFQNHYPLSSKCLNFTQLLEIMRARDKVLIEKLCRR